MNLGRQFPRFARNLIAIATAAATVSIASNIALLAILAAPIAKLWNGTVVPLGNFPAICYGQAFRFLTLIFLLKLALSGVQLSGKLRD